MVTCEQDAGFSYKRNIGLSTARVAGRLVVGWWRALKLVLLLGLLGVAGLVFAPASVAVLEGQGQCPNEDLRAALNSMALPDCRAYELVTPPYKEGYPLLPLSFSANGEKAILYSLASLAENPGSSESLIASSVYSATRTNAGWRLAALNAPLSQFIGQVPVLEAEEADKGETLWEQHEPDQSVSSRGLYVRSPAGDYSFIGPLSPYENPAEGPSDVIQGAERFTDQPVAATANYGKVIIESHFSEGRWPIDKTVGGETRSLYEYAGTDTKEPRLVAVEGGQNSTQLIGVCGASLGSGVSGTFDAYNAISANGERIFFTVAPISEGCDYQMPAPATAELYERVNGSLASAKTVHVSVDECTIECGETEPGKRAESGKNFEGASEDGGRVFFTSTQKLTNNAVDGTTSGNAAERKGCAGMVAASPEGGCNLYEFTDDHLVLVAGGEVLGVMDIAEDGSRVYFVKRTEENQGEEPVERDNIYLYEPGNQKTTYVATLSSKDEKDWLREASRRPVELAGKEGRFLLFASSTPGVTPSDTSELTQLFEYKAEAEGEPAELVRVTQGEAGYNQNGNNVITGVERSSIFTVAGRLVSDDFKSTANRLNISTDGHTIIFETSGELSPRARSSSKNCTNVYEFHSDGDLSTGTVNLLSAGQGTQLYKGVTCGAEFLYMDASGDNVLFTSVDSLVPDDVDGQRDIYDARVDGGFGVVTGGGCAGVAFCEGSSSTSVVSPAAGSNASLGEAPLAPPSTSKKVVKKARSKRKTGRCRRGFVRGRRGCMKRRAKASRSSARGGM